MRPKPNNHQRRLKLGTKGEIQVEVQRQQEGAINAEETNGWRTKHINDTRVQTPRLPMLDKIFGII